MKKLKNFKFNFNSSLWIGFALAFLYLPLVIMAIFSFNDSKSLSSWSGFSLRWYQELFVNQQMIDAIVVSVVSQSFQPLFQQFWERSQQLEYQSQNHYYVS